MCTSLSLFQKEIMEQKITGWGKHKFECLMNPWLDNPKEGCN